MGLVFQADALWPRLSVADNVGYGLKVRGVPRRRGGTALPRRSTHSASTVWPTNAPTSSRRSSANARPSPAPGPRAGAADPGRTHGPA